MLSASQIARFLKMYYLKKGMNDEVYIWHANKNGSLIQVDTLILGVWKEAYPKYPM